MERPTITGAGLFRENKTESPLVFLETQENLNKSKCHRSTYNFGTFIPSCFPVMHITVRFLSLHVIRSSVQHPSIIVCVKVLLQLLKKVNNKLEVSHHLKALGICMCLNMEQAKPSWRGYPYFKYIVLRSCIFQRLSPVCSQHSSS